MRLIVPLEDANIRLDTFISDKYEASRSQVQKAISKGILVNNVQINKPAYKVQENDIIEFELDTLDIKVVESPTDIDLDIKYQDDNILVINKQQGLVVHQSVSNREPITLVNALLKKNISLSNVDEIRRGIVHRLDKDTSGLMIIAKTDEAHLKLIEQFKNREVNRRYIGLCKGVFKESDGTLSYPITRDKKNRTRMAVDVNGKEAITKYSVIEEFKNCTLVNFTLVTGRTHQIRVHAKQINHPIIGDEKYGGVVKGFPIGQLLHCCTLEFEHPITKTLFHFEAEPNDIFKNTIRKLQLDKKLATIK